MRDEPLSNQTTDSTLYTSLQHIYTTSLDEVYDLLHKFRETTDKFQEENKGSEIVLMIEAYVNDTEYVKYFGDGKRKGAQIPFNFILITDMDEDSTAQDAKDIIDKKIASVPKGTRLNWVMGNHDRDRIGSRYGERRIDGFHSLIMTLPGIASSYNVCY